jgi:phosphoglycolate phosphatase
MTRNPFPTFSEPLPAAVVFDLDGTLVDTAPDLHAATNHALAQAGRDDITLTQCRGMIGEGLRRLIELGMVATGGPVDDDAMDRLVASAFAHYAGHLTDNSNIYDGVIEVLESLAAAKVQMAVCTNKPAGFSRRILADLGLARYFQAILGGDSFLVRKPDPAHLLGTLEPLGVAAKDAIMVGDSGTDVVAARNAGVPVIVMSYGYTQTPPAELGADAVVDSFLDLPAAFAAIR